MPFADPCDDRCAYAVQPGPAVCVIKCDAAAHLLHIRWGMKVVGVGELPSELLCQQAAYRRLSGAGDSHYDHDHAEDCRRSLGTRRMLLIGSRRGKSGGKPATIHFLYVFCALVRPLVTVNVPSVSAATFRYLPSQFSLMFAMRSSGTLWSLSDSAA